jgi:hypothetical protein
MTMVLSIGACAPGGPGQRQACAQGYRQRTTAQEKQYCRRRITITSGRSFSFYHRGSQEQVRGQARFAASNPASW